MGWYHWGFPSILCPLNQSPEMFALAFFSISISSKPFLFSVVQYWSECSAFSLIRSRVSQTTVNQHGAQLFCSLLQVPQFLSDTSQSQLPIKGMWGTLPCALYYLNYLSQLKRKTWKTRPLCILEYLAPSRMVDGCWRPMFSIVRKKNKHQTKKCECLHHTMEYEF